MEYFEFVATEIASNSDDGSVVDAFRPALDHISDQLTRVTLSHSQLLSFADVVVFFTRNVHLAEVSDICSTMYCISAHKKLLVPRTHNKLGDRIFSSAGPRLWNDLPPGLRRPGLSFDSFRRSLKTHLFGD